MHATLTETENNLPGAAAAGRGGAGAVHCTDCTVLAATSAAVSCPCPSCVAGTTRSENLCSSTLATKCRSRLAKCGYPATPPCYRRCLLFSHSVLTAWLHELPSSFTISGVHAERAAHITGPALAPPRTPLSSHYRCPECLLSLRTTHKGMNICSMGTRRHTRPTKATALPRITDQLASIWEAVTYPSLPKQRPPRRDLKANPCRTPRPTPRPFPASD